VDLLKLRLGLFESTVYNPSRHHPSPKGHLQALVPTPTRVSRRAGAACARLVCQIHDELITVLYSGANPTGFDRVCADCVEYLYETGEISQGEEYQYINRR